MTKLKILPRTFSKSKVKGNESVVWQATVKKKKLLHRRREIRGSGDQGLQQVDVNQPELFSGSSAITPDPQPTSKSQINLTVFRFEMLRGNVTKS